VIEVENLTKYYGRMAAIRNVNFRVDSGEIVGFLGPNGAGKTTTMRILTCFSPASQGNVRILGMDVQEDSLKIRRKLGYLPEHVPLYDWMRVKNYLDFVARAKGVAASERQAEIKRVVAAVGIEQVSKKLIKWLSKGFRQRVGLAQALIGDPPILILDEPTIGLDPKQIREIRQLIKGFARNRTVILSTHILPEVSQTCDRVIIINKGTIVAEDTPANLARNHRKSVRVLVVARAPEEQLSSAASQVSGIVSVNASPSRSMNGETGITVEASPETDVRPALARTILDHGWDLLELKMLQVSLEDVFIDLVTEESEEDSLSEEVPKEAAS
jgi:ABC-2 type transport system ATP-binding protein